MPIRIECRDQQRDRAQHTEDKGLATPLTEDAVECQTGSKRKYSTSCESRHYCQTHKVEGNG